MKSGRWRRRRCSSGPHVLDRDLGDVPLREHDQRRAVRLARDLDGGDVALDDALARVDQDERDVGALRGVERAQLGVVVDPLALLALAAQAGGVDEQERAAVVLEHRVDRVARRARHLESTIVRSSPTSLLKSDDLPTFGRPRIATRIASPATVRDASIRQPRRATSSSRSPVFEPCRPEIGNGSPKPSRWNS